MNLKTKKKRKKSNDINKEIVSIENSELNKINEIFLITNENKLHIEN